MSTRSESSYLSAAEVTETPLDEAVSFQKVPSRHYRLGTPPAFVTDPTPEFSNALLLPSPSCSSSLTTSSHHQVFQDLGRFPYDNLSDPKKSASPTSRLVKLLLPMT